MPAPRHPGDLGSGPEKAGAVRVHAESLQGEARVLGTSTDFVFLYWPSNGRTEAVAKDTLGRIGMLPGQRPVEGRAGDD